MNVDLIFIFYKYIIAVDTRLGKCHLLVEMVNSIQSELIIQQIKQPK